MAGLTRGVVALVLVAGLGSESWGRRVTAAGRRTTGPTTTLEEGLEGNLGRMIPRPNSGESPRAPAIGADGSS